MSQQQRQTRAIFSMLYMRAVYAVNWFNIAAVFSPMARDLSLDVSSLGLATSVFLGSVGIFQVPGGLLSAKIGAKKTIALGMIVSSVANALVVVAPDIYTITLLRAIVGFGMALVFSPGAVATSRLFGRSSESLGVGLYNGSFDLGGVAGLFGSAVLSQFVGWRPTLALGGILGLSSAAFIAWCLPRDETRSDFRISLHEVGKVLLHGPLLLLSITTLAIQVAWNTSGNFTVFYLEEVGMDPATAGLAGATALLLAFFASPALGRLNDRWRRPRPFLVGTGLVAAAGVALVGTGSVAGAFAGSALIGTAAGGGYTAAVVLARELNRGRQEYDALGVALINGVSNFASLTAPAIFAVLATRVSFEVAWDIVGLYVLVLLLPIGLRKIRSAATKEL